MPSMLAHFLMTWKLNNFLNKQTNKQTNNKQSKTNKHEWFVYQQKIPGRANAIYFSAFCDDLKIEYLVSSSTSFLLLFSLPTYLGI